MADSLTYLNGFRNHFESEALAGALVIGRNSPQKVPYGLYAEQLNGSAFSAPRHLNQYAWLYRIRPSVMHGEFTLVQHSHLTTSSFTSEFTPPTQMRWDPMPYPSSPIHFIESFTTIAGNGNSDSQSGAAIHLYAATKSMQHEYFYNADGELLIVPQEGRLRFFTEFGILDITPGEILVIPRGIKFQVHLIDKQARGYVCENFGAAFRIPDLGIIGANGLANPRDFLSPCAAYEDKQGDYQLLVKFQGRLWSSPLAHSPLDVVAWHGNYAPYKYDLALFNTIGSVSFDHPDPSIFTVLTSPSTIPGVANVDFVIFPPRWMVANDTFRPPYYHRNIMSEYMGLINGKYDAKENGFIPGGASLHNCMSAHGPDAEAFDKAVNAALKPEFYADTLAFMFESKMIWNLTRYGHDADFRQRDYHACWQGLKRSFQIKTNTI